MENLNIRGGFSGSDNIGVDAVADAIAAGYDRKKARVQQKQMISGMERAMRNKGRNRFTNPIAPNTADILPWYLYDEINVAVNTLTLSEMDFFTVPIGGTQFAVTKTKQQTNLEQVSQLPAPQHFNTTALEIYFASNMLKTDIDSTLNNYWLEFWIGQKVYAEGPLFKFPGGAGLAGVSQQSGQQGWSNGYPSPIAVVDFRMGDNPIGHHILQGQNFKVKILGTPYTTVNSSANPAGTGLNFYCILEGILSRGVQ
jgi:hypothetical protein